MSAPPTAVAPTGRNVFDVEAVRRDFPLLEQRLDGRRLVYLDSAATAQKPRAVLEAIDRFYRHDNANVHRGVYRLAERATAAYEEARAAAARFLGAGSEREVVFTGGTTEAINLVAASFVRPRLAPGKAVLVSEMEHHSNIVPWQLVCEATGAELRVVPIDDRGELIFEELERRLGEDVVLASFVHVSNALGTINPVARMVEAAHRHGVPVLIDGAQAAPHLPIDVTALGCDFYAFSGHKVFGPTGIGVLWGKSEHLAAMPPYQGGGEMIRSVTFSGTTYAEPPHRFEAGTPNVAGAVGLGAALAYVEAIGRPRIEAYETELLAYATERLGEVPGLELIGTAEEKASVLSFTVGSAHPHDVATILDRDAIAVRAGHHCAQPVMDRFGVPATTRASLALYNTREEIDRLTESLGKVVELFG